MPYKSLPTSYLQRQGKDSKGKGRTALQSSSTSSDYRRLSSRGGSGSGNGLTITTAKQGASINDLANLAIGVLVGRVARVTALTVVLARSSTRRGLSSSGLSRSDTSLDNRLAITAAQQRASIDDLANLTTGVLVSRVARITALVVILSRSSTSRGWGGTGLSRSGASLDDRLASCVNKKRAAVDVLARLAVGVLMSRIAGVAALAVVLARGSASWGLSSSRSGRGRSGGSVVNGFAVGVD